MAVVGQTEVEVRRLVRRRRASSLHAETCAAVNALATRLKREDLSNAERTSICTRLRPMVNPSQEPDWFFRFSSPSIVRSVQAEAREAGLVQLLLGLAVQFDPTREDTVLLAAAALWALVALLQHHPEVGKENQTSSPIARLVVEHRAAAGQPPTVHNIVDIVARGLPGCDAVEAACWVLFHCAYLGFGGRAQARARALPGLRNNAAHEARTHRHAPPRATQLL